MGEWEREKKYINMYIYMYRQINIYDKRERENVQTNIKINRQRKSEKVQEME